MFIIKYLQKEKKSSSEQNKNDIKVNARVSKREMTWNVNSKVNGI